MNRRNAMKIAMLGILAGTITAIYFSPLRQHLTRDAIRADVANFRTVWYGPIILIAAYAIGCVFALPASVFVVAAGYIWGWKLGGSYAMIGGLLGATASFFVARFVGEGLLTRFGRVGVLVKKQADHAGFLSLLVMRFIPGLPFAAVNYGAGVCGVRVSDFMLATVIGLAPSNFVFAYCADALFNGAMTEGDALKRLAVVCALMLGLVALSVVIKRFAAGARSPVLAPRDVEPPEAS
jgi:uncharacterized membrane protein YdjX (TVP38/TMEM64 family)